jgi:hypothetical protein
MEKYTDFTKFRTESDIKLAKVTLKHKATLHEQVLSDTFRNFGEYLTNSLKIAAIQIGTSALTAALIRLIRLRSK